MKPANGRKDSSPPSVIIEATHVWHRDSFVLSSLTVGFSRRTPTRSRTGFWRQTKKKKERKHSVTRSRFFMNANESGKIHRAAFGLRRLRHPSHLPPPGTAHALPRGLRAYRGPTARTDTLMEKGMEIQWLAYTQHTKCHRWWLFWRKS